MITKEQAIKQGLKHYDDPNGCINDHKNVKRLVSTRTCTQCNAQYARNHRMKAKQGLVKVSHNVPEEHVETLNTVVKNLGGE